MLSHESHKLISTFEISVTAPLEWHQGGKDKSLSNHKLTVFPRPCDQATQYQSMNEVPRRPKYEVTLT
jgi:hypothetical protein